MVQRVTCARPPYGQETAMNVHIESSRRRIYLVKYGPAIK